MTTGLDVFDATVQQTNLWLKDLMARIPTTDRHYAYQLLRATLHTFRDRVGPENAVHFGAQLPMLIRGFYYEGWHMAGKPTKDRHIEEFAEHVLKELPPKFPLDALTVSRGVFEALWEKLDPGEFAKLMDHLPVSLRTLRP